MNLKDVFNQTITENGDTTYISTKNKYLDVLFQTENLTKDISKLNITLDRNNEFDRLFAMFIRDPRLGLGKRKLGRELLYQTLEDPKNIAEIGRCDDIFELGFRGLTRKTLKENFGDYKTGGKYWAFLRKVLNGEESDLRLNVTKWVPKLNRPKIENEIVKLNKDKVTLFRKSFEKKLSEKEYRKLVKNDFTTESKIRKNKEIDYEKVPSKALLKYSPRFNRVDEQRFNDYLREVQEGNKKINTGTLNVYDICLSHKTDKISDDQADILFNNIPKVNLGKMLAIVDNSASMYDNENSYLKARAVGHYIAKNSSYLNNHIVTFSEHPKLLELSNDYSSDMKILNSFKDVSKTNFGRVMKMLSKVTQDLPDYLVVLSDMEFDNGSALKKDESMKILRKLNENIKIIWWNFNVDRIITPETDEYGNIFISGYNPTLLSMLDYGMDGEKFLKKIIEDYKEKIKDKIKL